MNCDECKENLATVHVTEMYNGQKSEMHLCPSCAAKKGALVFDPSQFQFNLPNLLGGFLGGNQALQGKGFAGPTAQLACQNCGVRFVDIRNSGKLGCPKCYQAFEDELESALKRIHGNSQHTGKIPLRSGEKTRIKRQVDDLKEQLQAAIMAEEYEKAAEIRDALKELEKKLD
ncbi:MAG: UvrB/UvrC motif-containing protein [Syntrophomonadaceae bacterium]|jgi:protein arginine kinase activator